MKRIAGIILSLVLAASAFGLSKEPTVKIVGYAEDGQAKIRIQYDNVGDYLEMYDTYVQWLGDKDNINCVRSVKPYDDDLVLEVIFEYAHGLGEA